MFPTQITVQWHVRNGESRIWHCCQCCQWLLPNKMFAKDGLFKMPQWNTQACSCISIVEQQSTTHMWLSKSNLKMVAWLLMEMMTFRNEVRKWSHIETGHFSSEIMNLGKMNAWHNAQKNWVCSTQTARGLQQPQVQHGWVKHNVTNKRIKLFHVIFRNQKRNLQTLLWKIGSQHNETTSTSNAQGKTCHISICVHWTNIWERFWMTTHHVCFSPRPHHNFVTGGTVSRWTNHLSTSHVII